MPASARSFRAIACAAGALLLLLAVSACGGDDDDGGSDGSSLEGTEWTLVSGVDAPEDAVPTLLLEDGNASGFGGCNRFAGGYELDGDSLSLGPLASTQMACEEPKSNAEFAYHQALDSVDAWAIEDGDLVLSSGGDEVLRYAGPDG